MATDWLLTVPFHEMKSCGVVTYSNKKKDKTKNSLGLHFKAYNLKDMFSALGKMNLFR